MDKVNDELDLDTVPTGAREEWTGPKHAKGRRGLRAGTPSSDLLKDFAVSGEKGPYERGQVAEPGGYEKSLDSTSFARSHILRDVAPYIESGDFEGGLQATEAALANRHIPYESVPADQLFELTRINTLGDDIRSTIVLPDDFRKLPNEMQLWELLHRNMELILRRRGVSLVPTMATDIYDMAFAYARTLRLGVQDKGPAKAPVEVSADMIEDWAISKLKLARRIT